MCLQDYKIREGYESRGRVITSSSGPTQINVGAAANRRMIRFAYPGNVADLAANSIIVMWLPDSGPISVGQLTESVPYFALDILHDGQIVYGPFNFAFPDGTGVSVAVSELLDNTGEDNSV